MSHQRINAMWSSKDVMHGLSKEDGFTITGCKKEIKFPHFLCCFSTATQPTVSLFYLQKAVVATHNINTTSPSCQKPALGWDVTRQTAVCISHFRGAEGMHSSAHTHAPCKTRILNTICENKKPTSQPTKQTNKTNTNNIKTPIPQSNKNPTKKPINKKNPKGKQTLTPPKQTTCLGKGNNCCSGIRKAQIRSPI